jgi:hypothetical protein
MAIVPPYSFWSAECNLYAPCEHELGLRNLHRAFPSAQNPDGVPCGEPGCPCAGPETPQERRF